MPSPKPAPKPKPSPHLKQIEMTLSLAALDKNTEADAAARLFDGGQLRIYSGTVPATADTALSGNTLLATLTFATPSGPASSGGVFTASAITSASAAATGTASFFRVLESNGTTVVMQGAVGTSGSDLNLNTTSIVSGATVAVSSFTYTRS